MKKARKDLLIYMFPALTEEQETKMKGRGATNFCVFLTQGQELFVRCYHRYSNGRIEERNRYVFARDGSCRWRFDKRWIACTKFREPVFSKSGGGWNFDNTYNILGFEAIEKSDMRYSQVMELMKTESFPISYLHLYCQHPNLEYIVKAGYYESVVTATGAGYLGREYSLIVTADIDWKSNNLLKMLRLNRTEFKALQGHEYKYREYIWWRNRYPQYAPYELLAIVDVYGMNFGTADTHTRATGLSIKRLARYLLDNKIEAYNFSDYIDQCRQLGYNLSDTSISMPHDFQAMHERLSELSELIKVKANADMLRAFAENYEVCKQYECEYQDYIVRQPQSVQEIVDEGKALHHCVGGYVKRHAYGQTTIMFLRRREEPDKPFYTIEVLDYKIKQCHGYRNDVDGKLEEVKEFEEFYKNFLGGLKHERNYRVRTA